VTNEEDEARLSPLVYRHVNMLGHYAFTLPDSIRNRELRQLNQLIEKMVRALSRPEEFHLQPLTDSVREPLDSYGSCQPFFQYFSILKLRRDMYALPLIAVRYIAPWVSTSPSLHSHYKNFITTTG